ncbi:condensation domain-containing protein, partial [Micromonospora siamensis]
SFAQQRLWFLAQFNPGGVDYNASAGLRLVGGLDRSALVGALGDVVARHEVLRTRLVSVGGVGVQVVEPAGSVSAEVRFVDGVSAGALDDVVLEEVSRPFDVSVVPLVRALVVGVGVDEHVVVLTFHHVAVDGWSLGLLTRELGVFYDARVRGVDAGLPVPVVQYADFAVWQRSRLTERVLAEGVGYWRRQLAGVPVLELPVDRPRPAVRSTVGAVVRGVVPAQTVAGLSRLCRARGATLFMALTAAVQVVLGRWSGSSDVAVGSVTAGRDRRELQDMVGFFVNTVVLRSRIAEQESFGQLLGRVRETVLEAFAHQDVPFERLVEELVEQRDPSRSPLFQAMVVVQNAPVELPRLSGLAVTEFELPCVAAQFEVTVEFTVPGPADPDQGLQMVVEFNTDLFDESTMVRLGEHIVELLRVVAADAVAEVERPLALVDMLPAAERDLVVQGFNDTTMTVPQPHCVQELFAQRVARTPDAIAVIDQAGPVTFAELDTAANRVAHWLRAAGAGPGSLVGLCVSRGRLMPLGMLAVLRSGAAFVPLDPGYPDDRLAHMITDSGTTLVLTEHALHQRLSAAGPHTRWLALDDTDTDTAGLPDTTPEHTATPDDLA